MTSSILRVQSCNCTVGLGLIVVLRLAPPPTQALVSRHSFLPFETLPCFLPPKSPSPSHHVLTSSSLVNVCVALSS
jgi:hypothetical protein